MTTEQKTKPRWVQELERRLREPVSEEELARRRAHAARVRALRASLPSIAPDTTSQYIRAIRDEAS